jgi:hypothetical protein
MPLQHRLLARPSPSGGRSRSTFARSQLAFLAAVLFFGLASASSAAREPGVATKVLLEAFPLNPTGERIVSAGDRGVFRPPVQQVAAVGSPDARSATRAAASGANVFVLAVIGGGSIAALLAALAVVLVLRPASSRPHGPSEEPSAYVSAVFIGANRLPVIEGSARVRRGVPWAARAVWLLVGCASVGVVALLVVQYAG